LRILANQLERRAGLHVTVGELQLGRQFPGWRRQLDQMVGLVDEASPDRVGICCTLWNAAAALDVARRLTVLWPALELVLWGSTAEAVLCQLGSGPARAVGDPLGGLGGIDGEPDQIAFCRDRLDELVRAATQFREPLTVERLSGPRLPLHQQRGNRLPFGPDRLELAQALAWIPPLLHSGLAVRVDEPALTTDRGPLDALLDGVGSGRLVLELPAEVLDRDLVQRLLQVGVQQVDLDLAGELPDTMLSLVQRLTEAGVRVRGRLLLGHPALGHAQLGEQVDRCLAQGVEDLALTRLVVPPGSPLRREPGLVLDPQPPYRVLAHARAAPAEILRGVRLAATLELLRDSVVGTGVLRALGQSSGGVFELLEGFGDSLVGGNGLLWREPPRAVERLFAEYLRTHHGIDLEAGEGQLRLVRSPGLSLRWLGDGNRVVSDEATGKEAHMGRGALALIDRCERAHTIHELCEQLVAEAPSDRRDRLRRELHATVDKLATMGFLVPHLEGGGSSSSEPPFIGLDEFDYHYRMLMDRSRVEAYREAIERVVQPGQHVVEVGTGTGILAVLAAKRGARVTAIERYAVVEMARELARRNGVAGAIEFIRGRSDLVTLEQPGDVLITELVGNRILNEGLLEVTLDARRRLLRPGAELLPRRVEIFARLAQTGHVDRLQREMVAMGRRYDVDLTPLAGWLEASRLAGTLVWEQSGDVELTPLSPEARVVSIDLRRLETNDITVTSSAVADRPGVANAVVLAFRLELHPGITVSNLGDRHGLHWNKPVVMLARSARLEAGTELGLRLRYEVGGELRIELV